MKELQINPPIEVQQPDPVLAIIAQAASDPSVDVAKMEQLLAMRERVLAREAKIAYAGAMRSAQSEMRPVVRDAENSHTHSRYARLETIDKLIRPIYTKHGFSLSFNSPAVTEQGVTVSCSVMHDRGHSERHELTGALDTSGAKGSLNKTEIQGLGSSVSYLRRYLKVMIFDITIANEDNDGNGADTLTQDQINKVDDMLIACNLQDGSQAMNAFLEFARARRVRDIKQCDFARVMQALLKKAHVKNQEAEKRAAKEFRQQ